MFHNDWEQINSMPDEAFNRVPFIEMISDASSWEMPPTHVAVVRAYNRKKGKLKEYACKTIDSAQKRIQHLAERGDDVTVLTHEAIAVINYDVPDDDNN